MYKGGKGIGLKQVISIAVIVVCFITLLSPWVHIGLRKTNGGMLDANSVVKMANGSGISDIVEEFRDTDIDDFIYDEIAPQSARKSLNSAKKAMVKVGEAAADSKLTPVETASVCTNFAKVLHFLNQYDENGTESATVVISIVGVALWLWILALVVLGVRGILAGLTGREMRLGGLMCGYLALSLLYFILSFAVNREMAAELGGALSWFGIKSATVLHIQLAPILGSILLIANQIVGSKLSEDALTVNFGEIGTEIGGVTKKMVWKCECGAMNPSTSRFCPRCGKSRPEDSDPADIAAGIRNKMSWTCACGSVNSQRDGFCTSCGAKRPADVAGVGAKAVTPPVSYCKKCGRPAEPGTNLCRDCRMGLDEESTVYDRPMAEYDTGDPEMDRTPDPGIGRSRIKKNFRPPTTLD